MATKPKQKSEPTVPDGQKTANERLAACRTWKSYVEIDFKECYFLAAPWRQRQISSMTQPGTQRMMDAGELNTDLAFLIVQDFITEVVNTYMPEAQNWCERGPGMDLPQELWDTFKIRNRAGKMVLLKDQVKIDDGVIFRALKASNFYPEITKAFYPDLAIGTVGLWIQRPQPHKAIVASAIPLRELEINLGPYGEIDDRFAVRYTRNSYVEGLLGPEIWAKVPEALKQKCKSKPTEKTQIVWGFWRKWEKIDDEYWCHVVLLGDKLVHETELKGEGSCPLLVGRWNPSADWPHGQGPLIQGLPSFRQVDELERMRIENSSLSLAPPISFPDDSFAAVEQGLEEGMAYPIRNGTEGAIKPIYKVPEANVANYAYEEKEKRLKKLHFVDFPEQTGDTPPTLGQWLDEMARAQRRIGTPGLPFWREMCAAIFLRYKFLLETAGTIMPVQVNGVTVALTPYNPAQAAAEQQEVGMTVKAIQILGQAFPEEFKLHVDGEKSMVAILEKMRVTLLKMRDPDEVKAALAQISQLVGGQQPGAAPADQAQPGPPQ